MWWLAISVSVLCVFVILFLSFWIPSSSAALSEKGQSDLDIRKNWRWYLAAIAGTTLGLLIWHFVADRGEQIPLHDIPYMYIAPLLGVSPAARRIYRAMKNFILRK